MRRMPWTGAFFLIGCISISALPPFNGFVSEWLTFQAALQAWTLDSGVLRSVVPIAAAMLALTGALAAACFVKVFGIAFLGQARSRPIRRAREVATGMLTGQAILAALCLVFGILPTGTVAMLNVIPTHMFGIGLSEATAHGWLWLTPVSVTTASYSAPLVVLSLVVIGAFCAWFLRRSAVQRVRRSDAWDCGFAPPTSAQQYTATAFAQPIRQVFGLLFHIDEAVEPQQSGLRRHRLHISDRIWGIFYLPVARAVERTARRVVRLQSGNVRIYLGWSLATLLVLLWIMV